MSKGGKVSVSWVQRCQCVPYSAKQNTIYALYLAHPKPYRKGQDCSSLREVQPPGDVQPDKCMALPLHWTCYHSGWGGFYLGGHVELYQLYYAFVSGWLLHVLDHLASIRRNPTSLLLNAGVSGILLNIQQGYTAYLTLRGHALGDPPPPLPCRVGGRQFHEPASLHRESEGFPLRAQLDPPFQEEHPQEQLPP